MLTSCGYLVRARVRCGRNRAPSTSMPARLAAARQPVASRSSSVRPGSSRSRPAHSTFARPAFGNAPPPAIASRRRSAATRPGPAARPGRRASGPARVEERERHVHLVGLHPAELARVAAYVEELVEVLERLGRRHQRGEEPHHRSWVPSADPIA